MCLETTSQEDIRAQSAQPGDTVPLGTTAAPHRWRPVDTQGTVAWGSRGQHRSYWQVPQGSRSVSPGREAKASAL